MDEPSDKVATWLQPLAPIDPPEIEALRLQRLQTRLLGRGGAIRVGRYELVRPLGTGGEATVYEARDTELQRSVAIRIMAARGDDRWIEQARALALLRHPNVVAIHDVGSGEHPFVVMELLEGPRLDAWCAEPRAWLDVLSMFVRVGRGLAHAHAHGVVHGDFKPANVVLDRDLEPKVVDFGGPRSNARPGATTRHYTAPERLRGGAPDALADQYAFCVALDDALEPSGGERTVRRLRELLARGRDIDPRFRHASLDELLAEIDRVLRSRSRRRTIAVAGAGLLAAAIVVAAPDGPSECARDPRAIVDAMWNPAVEAEIAGAIERLELPYGAHVWSRTRAAIDERVDAWARARTEACGSAPERLACLDEGLAGLRAVIDDLREGSITTFESLPASVERLPAPSDCASPHASGPPACAATDAFYRGLAWLDAGRREEAASLADDALLDPDLRDRCRSGFVRWQALRAEAGTDPDSEAMLRQAWSELERAHDLPMAARAMLAIAERRASADDWPAATQMLDLVRALAERHPLPPAVAAGLELREGLLHERLGHYDAAIEMLERARTNWDALHGGPSLAGTRASLGLAIVFNRRGDHPHAIEAAERAVSSSERMLGPDHPQTARAELTLASLLVAAGRYPEAEPRSAHALAVLTAAPIRDDDRLGVASTLAASIASALGHGAKARAAADDAMAAYRRSHPRPDSHWASAHNLIAAVEGDLGRPRYALSHAMEALQLYERTLGPDHLRVGYTLAHAASLAASLGRLDDAQRWNDRAIAVFETHAPTGHDLPLARVTSIELLRRRGLEIDAAALLDELRTYAERALAPEDPVRALVWLRIAELHRSDRPALALEACEHAHAMWSTSPRAYARYLVRVELVRAGAWLELGERARADDAAARALAMAEQFAVDTTERGEAELALARTRPDRADFHRERARSFFLRMQAEPEFLATLGLR